MILGLFYGLRRSEVLGLKWDSVDFDAGTLTIKHTVGNDSSCSSVCINISAALIEVVDVSVQRCPCFVRQSKSPEYAEKRCHDTQSQIEKT